MIVLKFGGTSVKDARSMEKVLGIIKERPNEPQLIVLSACSGVTDNLLEISENAAKGDIHFAKGLTKQIHDRHKTMASMLIRDDSSLEEAISDIGNLIRKLEELIDGIAILRECTPLAHSKCVAFGEYLSTALFFHYCKTQIPNCRLLDSSDLIKTLNEDRKEAVDFEKTQNLIKQSIAEQDGVTIVQGFIASNGQGKLTTFNRGGSDFSASIYGAALKAEQIEIWTDVSGVLSGDPRIVPEAKPIEVMSFDEVRELSYYGAKVLHPETIKPAMNKDIPVKILNTFDKNNSGTTILSEITTKGKIKSLIMNSNCPVLINDKRSLSEAEIRKVNNYISKNELRVLFSSISDKRVFFLLDKSTDRKKLTLLADSYNIKVRAYDTIILCGNDIRIDPGLLNALEQTADVNFKGIFYGHSKYSLISIYSAGYGTKALMHLHKKLIEEKFNLSSEKT